MSFWQDKPCQKIFKIDKCVALIFSGNSCYKYFFKHWLWLDQQIQLKQRKEQFASVLQVQRQRMPSMDLIHQKMPQTKLHSSSMKARLLQILHDHWKCYWIAAHIILMERRFLFCYVLKHWDCRMQQSIKWHTNSTVSIILLMMYDEQYKAQKKPMILKSWK